MGLRQLVEEQAREFICGEFGHSWKFVLPLQTKDAKMQVFCGCDICGERQWISFPPTGYRRLLLDAAEGKVK